MSNLTDCFLSHTTVESFANSLDLLDKLSKRTLRASMQSEFRKDAGVNNFGLIVAVFHHSSWRHFNSLTAEQLLSMKLIELLSNEIAPALAEVVVELFEVWETIKVAVVANDGGLDAFNEFVRKAADAEVGSSKIRYDRALKKYQKALRVQDMARVSELADGIL